MTDTELPPCFCGHSPQLQYDRWGGLYRCKNYKCPLHLCLFSTEKWTALHTPAQVLREIFGSYKSLMVEPFFEGGFRPEYITITKQKWEEFKRSIEKAQQLSGRES